MDGENIKFSFVTHTHTHTHNRPGNEMSKLTCTLSRTCGRPCAHLAHYAFGFALQIHWQYESELQWVLRLPRL